jgi:hypothetical protein
LVIFNKGGGERRGKVYGAVGGGICNYFILLVGIIITNRRAPVAKCFEHEISILLLIFQESILNNSKGYNIWKLKPISSVNCISISFSSEEITSSSKPSFASVILDK